MSRNRTVANGGTFKVSTTKAAKTMFGVCASCGIRPAGNFDHIRRWEWGGNNSIDNCAHICTKCHSEKSDAEKEIRKDSDIEAFVAKWQAIVKNADGSVKSITRELFAKNKKIIRMITVLEMKGRKATDEVVKHNLKLQIAAIHREHKAA